MVRLQSEALAESGEDVKVFPRFSDELSVSKTYPLRAGLRTILGSEKGLQPALVEFKPDVVHVHNLFPNFGNAWMLKCPFPIVATLHNFRLMCANGTLFRSGNSCTLCPDSGSHNAVVHRCYKGSSLATIPLAIATRGELSNTPVIAGAKQIITMSSRARDIFSRYGVPESKLNIIPNFRSNAIANPAAEEDHWCFLGRLEHGKGILELINVWPEGRSLHIYGDGPLREAVVAKQRPGVVYQGFAGEGQISSILSSSQGLVFPSFWFESAPTMTYLAALSVGRPTVALQGNAVADDIIKSGSGMVVRSVEEIPAALIKVENTPIYGKNAMRRFSSEFTENRWLERMAKLYSRAIAG